VCVLVPVFKVVEINTIFTYLALFVANNFVTVLLQLFAFVFVPTGSWDRKRHVGVCEKNT